jgi:hypothetical protein
MIVLTSFNATALRLQCLFHRITDYSPQSCLCYIYNTDQVFAVRRRCPCVHPLTFPPSLPRYVEFIGMYPDQPRILPNSVYLQPTTPLNERDVDESEMTFAHPQSQFHLGVHDDGRSLSLPLFLTISDSPHALRFSTRRLQQY